jgi:hypothetical protein
MIPLDYALAVALLTTCPELPDNAPPPPAEHLQSIRETAQSLAIGWEVLDPRESKYVLARSEDYAADLKLLRRRVADLGEAPPLHDCMRFPDRALVNDLLAFNRTYRQNIDALQPLDPHHVGDLKEVLAEIDHLYQVWDLVRDARCEYYYVTVRRQALKKLRDLVGEEAYLNGSLPPHVPVWRFAKAE